MFEFGRKIICRCKDIANILLGYFQDLYFITNMVATYNTTNYILNKRISAYMNVLTFTM